jgi:hypothetical protein
MQLRQASVYGLAKAVYASPSMVAPHLGRVLPCLMQVVQAEAERAEKEAEKEEGEEDDVEEEEEDGEGTVENAVFALGTIVCEPIYRAALAGLDARSVGQIAQLWLSKMPLTTDETQAKASSKQLADCVDRGKLVVEYLPQVLRIVAQIIKNSTPSDSQVQVVGGGGGDQINMHPETLARLKAQMRALFQAQAQALQGAFAELSPELQQALTAVL